MGEPANLALARNACDGLERQQNAIAGSLYTGMLGNLPNQLI
jgi:hypothetical protein